MTLHYRKKQNNNIFSEQRSEETIAQLKLELAERAENNSVVQNVDEQIQRLEEEVSRLKSYQQSSVSPQDLRGLRKAQEELTVREKEWQKERSFLQEQLNNLRKELHSATIREEEHRLKVLQIDELQREVDKTLAVLEKEREDCVKAEELQRLREEQLKDKVRHQEELEKSAFDQKQKELKEWRERWYSVSESLRHAHTLLQQAQDSRDQAVSSLKIQQDKNHSLRDDLHKLHSTLVEKASTVSRLERELQDAEHQRDLLDSRVSELSCEIQQQKKDCRPQTEQDEVSSRDETVQRLTADLRTTEENLTSARQELAGQMQEVWSSREDAVALQKELSRLQEILKHREELIEENNLKTTQLQRDADCLHKQCEGQKKELCNLREKVQRWQQEAQEQMESWVKEMQDLKTELSSTQSRLQQHRQNLHSLSRKQRDTEDKASCREATLRSQDSELIKLKAGLQEAKKLATDAQARLQPLTESLQICKHKYQTCLSKIGQLQNTLHSREEDLKEAHSKVALREEQLLHLRAQVACLQEDLQVHCTQLETGDDAITTLSQKLRDTQTELEHSRKHTQECELLISTLRDTAERLQRQVEDQEETLVKTQADFSIYRATHIHSDSDYESQLSRVQELEHALFQSLERCGQSVQELRVCQLEMARHKDCSPAADMQRLQEQLRKLQADAADEVHRQAQVDSLEQKVANLEGELQAAQRQCDQAIQKRDALLRQSEADLLQARDKIRGRAAEAERQAVSARGLEADLQRAKKEKRQKEKECASLKTQLLQLREQLKEANTTCRDTGQELMRQQEKLQLLEGGQRLTQDQLSERVAELLRAEKAHGKLQAELKRTSDSLENTQQELQDSRSLLDRLKAEASSSRQDVLGAQQEAMRLQQEKQQIREELNVCRESLLAMQSKLSEQEKLINHLQLLNLSLQEEGVKLQKDLKMCRGELESRDTQQQKHQQEMSCVQAVVCRLKLELEQQQESWKQADQRSNELRLELSTAQASQKDYMELLAEYSREVSVQRSEQSRLIQLTEDRAALEERVRLMTADLHRERTHNRSSQEEARACEGRLAELHTQLSHSQQWAQQQTTALQDREEELRMLKMEMAALRENYTATLSQVEVLSSQMDTVNQKYSSALCEANVLRQCLGDARTDSSRLHRESELVVTNVNQWVKEQKHTNEKLALKIKEQSRKIIHLTAERDHLQENVKGLQGEIRRLKTRENGSRETQVMKAEEDEALPVCLD
ncbi:LOW QUALITY PROTEIN: centrosome-associated protein CEP250 [Danio aesculapii]|uniref:LOW QUALITY PROTEIN: centrosome-associated protein CEP250 n=1 Tax=Danio aesculapii TaxID=1142201 RepID=UPI0024BF3392|nr:LOW QUALITY PROTEIN: centrosome-associated protein CEP250 [Danio aesculapii]